MSQFPMPILVPKNHPARAEVEALIAGVYAREYGARITTFADLLIALPNSNGVSGGGFWAAAGLRLGGDFFSEIYLDQPIEQVLSKCWQPPATRDEIAEVTTLAAVHPNASHALFSAITGYLRGQGVRFAFFTVTERLAQMLKRVGVPAQVLADARAERIANAADWGRYYASNPKVMAIHDAFVSVRTITMPAHSIDASADKAVSLA
ncbi:MAG: thermostable hemolysin [Rhodospirillales bacterium]|nr:thermostable hemolysin [Rhodospirillales bacterium]